MIELKDIWKIPNLISLSRVIILPFFIYFLPNDDYFYLSLFLFLLIVLSDFLDGYISRRFDMVSSLGKVIDPASDKIVSFGIILALVIYKGLPLWFLIMLTLRDLLLIVGGLWIYKFYSVVPSANIWGKLSTVFLVLLVLWYMAVDKVGFSSNLPLYLASTFIVVATISYFTSFFKIIRSS